MSFPSVFHNLCIDQFPHRPHTPNHISCLFSQPNHHSTDYLSLCTSMPVMPTSKGSNSGNGRVYRRKELWVEDGRGERSALGNRSLVLLSLRCIDPFHRQVTAGRLPDVVLLEIFDFYIEGEDYLLDDWQILLHVCRRWRNVVFSSPHRLDIQLICKPGRSVTEMLNIWPELPIFVMYDDPPVDTDDVIAALKLKGSVSKIELVVNSGSAVWEKFAAVMQDPFPMLEHLSVESYYGMTPVISDSFLGGSAPRLQSVFFRDILFPALPILLLSATDLVDLFLWDIPHSAYISPEAMVTCVSELTRLKSLSLHFRSPRSRPDSVFLHPLRRALLPALTNLQFKGVPEYLEDLVARIDVPLLERTGIIFFNQLIFDVSQLPDLVCRTETFTVLDQADVVLDSDSIRIQFRPKDGAVNFIRRLDLEISCPKLDWQLSALAQVCNSCLPTLPSLERLSICEYQYSPLLWQDDVENTQWLELLQPFATVKNLYLSKKVALCVASALQELSKERVTGLLPALQDIFIDGLRPPGLV